MQSWFERLLCDRTRPFRSVRIPRMSQPEEVHSLIRPASGEYPAERFGWVEAAWILLASVPLFINLGGLPAWGSESRWLSIASRMRESGNWLEPLLQGEFYGDKPLLSYWAIAAVSFITGRVDEFTARIPSALAGALTALAAGWLAARLFGRRYSVLSGCILLTAGALYRTSRGASADLLNLAFATGAVLVYVESTIRWRRWHPLLFFGLLALGGNAKGMPGVLVPLAVAGADILLSRRFDFFRRMGWIALGCFLGFVLYLTPFVLSYLDRGNWDLLRLVWRENFVRAVDAFDHTAPVYYYAYIFPAMFLPWTPWLAAGVGWAAHRARSHAGFRFTLLALAVIFVAFTLSNSRRSYYILPIFPYAALATAAFCIEAAEMDGEGVLSRTWSRLAFVPVHLVAFFGALACVFFLVGPLLPGLPGDLASALPYPVALSALSAAAVVAILVTRRRRQPKELFFALVAVVVLVGLYLSTGGDQIHEPGLIERPFATAVKAFCGDRRVYCGGVNSRLRYYLGEGPGLKSPEDIHRLLETGAQEVLVACGDAFHESLERSPDLVPDEVLTMATPGFSSLDRRGKRYLLVRCRAPGGFPGSYSVSDTKPK